MENYITNHAQFVEFQYKTTVRGRLCSRITPRCSLFTQHLQLVQTKLFAYTYHVRSMLGYANIVYFLFTKQSNKLEGVQREAIKYIHK